ncbi:TIR domain-containing protein [Photobacterium damselae]|uniref:TIR domain-containing protein n=1 Tax=Photobacterium damselae TaxID=38293 RepID=UPI003C6DC41B
MNKHKVFISYHHRNDQKYKEELLNINKKYGIFIDASVNTGDIDPDLSDQSIRTKIRDEYLKDSTVTIILVGIETKYRKHIDWEIYSSMYDGDVNKKSGILVVMLPDTNCNSFRAAHGDKEKQLLYPSINSWISIDSQAILKERYPYAPQRIIENLKSNSANISIVSWETFISSLEIMSNLIDWTFKDREKANYDLSTAMRRNNSGA